ncbi:hypothetical protein QJS66_05590 [Kocuria rhizophila]|nr:hypothetical protein QJS66_05590 [Kocuria rhizophila]
MRERASVRPYQRARSGRRPARGRLPAGAGGHGPSGLRHGRGAELAGRCSPVTSRGSARCPRPRCPLRVRRRRGRCGGRAHGSGRRRSSRGPAWSCRCS